MLYILRNKDNNIETKYAEKLIERTASAFHTSGDARLLYQTLDLRAAGSGESLRTRTRVYGTGISAAHGEHCTLAIQTGATISGLGCGLRATLEAAAESRTLTGTLCALQVDSYIGANNTLPAAHAFVRFTNVGSVVLSNLFSIPNASNGTLLAAHTTDAMTHSIKIISENGTAYYIMCTTTVTNRS